MTQLDYAKKNCITPEIKAVSEREGLEPQVILEGLKAGNIVIPKNVLHNVANICGIGKLLKTKVNANIGTSSDTPDISHEMEKLRVSIGAGADTVMDLSVGSSIDKMLSAVLAESTVPVGTVPIYEVTSRFLNGNDISNMRWEDIEETLLKQARLGVDFFTIHAGVTSEIVEFLKKRERILDVVSRGGSLMVDWIIKTGKENPF